MRRGGTGQPQGMGDIANEEAEQRESAHRFSMYSTTNVSTFHEPGRPFWVVEPAGSSASRPSSARRRRAAKAAIGQLLHELSDE